LRVALLSRGAHPLHDPGGLERAVYHLARHLQARGVETVLLTRPATREGTFPGEVLTVPYGGRASAHGRILDRTLHYPRFSDRLGERVAALVRAGRVDVVHAQGLTALGYGRRRRRDSTLTAPLIMNPQGMEEHKTAGLKRLALSRLRLLSRRAARVSDRVIATDESTRAEVVALLGVEPANVVVLPNGIDPDAIAAATPSDSRVAAEGAVPALAEADPVFVSVGRIEGYKGFEDTLRAFRVLADAGRLPPRWAWVVVGDGPGRTALAWRAGGSLTGHVHLAGRVDEPTLHALYARADVFVHASRFEGSSLVTLEAMAHGLPVVATSAGGIPDKVEDGVTGRLVSPGDVDALAAAIAELARDGSRAEMGRQGRARALACFAWPAIAERTLALYRELTERRP